MGDQWRHWSDVLMGDQWRHWSDVLMGAQHRATAAGPPLQPSPSTAGAPVSAQPPGPHCLPAVQQRGNQ